MDLHSTIPNERFWLVYTRKAKVMAKVRHILVDVLGDVLGDEQRWIKFARKVNRTFYETVWYCSNL